MQTSVRVHDKDTKSLPAAKRSEKRKPAKEKAKETVKKGKKAMT